MVTLQASAKRFLLDRARIIVLLFPARLLALSFSPFHSGGLGLESRLSHIQTERGWRVPARGARKQLGVQHPSTDESQQRACMKLFTAASCSASKRSPEPHAHSITALAAWSLSSLPAG